MYFVFSFVHTQIMHSAMCQKIIEVALKSVVKPPAMDLVATIAVDKSSQSMSLWLCRVWRKS